MKKCIFSGWALKRWTPLVHHTGQSDQNNEPNSTVSDEKPKEKANLIGLLIVLTYQTKLYNSNFNTSHRLYIIRQSVPQEEKSKSYMFHQSMRERKTWTVRIEDVKMLGKKPVPRIRLLSWKITGEADNNACKVLSGDSLLNAF